MLSRRSVRIKIMQVLYGAAVSENTLTPEVAEKLYRHKVTQTYHLYLYTLMQLQRVLEYTEHDAAYRLTKILKMPEDLAFDSRLLDNIVAKSLMENATLNRELVTQNLRYLYPHDFPKKFYYDFHKTPNFQAFLQLEKTEITTEQYIQIILDLFKHLLNDETFCDVMEDAFVNWDDDKSLVVGAVKRSIKTMHEDFDFTQKFIPDEETIGEFGSELLYKITFFDTALTEQIDAKLENWDADRVNRIDRILLTMALAEILYCDSIPVKVSLDEYIELAKMYSTDKSKEFVNGIADQLVRDVTEAGNLHKQGRGLNEA
jgi:transcription antitermination protein NusB